MVAVVGDLSRSARDCSGSRELRVRMVAEMTSSGIVIAGAGLCGGNAAATLRDEGYRERVLLIGDEPGAPFGRPPLSKTYLRGEEDLAGWQWPAPASRASAGCALWPTAMPSSVLPHQEVAPSWSAWASSEARSPHHCSNWVSMSPRCSAAQVRWRRSSAMRWDR